MSRKVRIKTSLSVNIDGTEERMIHSFSGEWRVREETHLLSHDEEDNRGRTNILLDCDAVEIRRKGIVSSRMRFVKDRGVEAEYITPHGQIPMMMITTEMSSQVNATGGKLNVCYTLQTDEKSLSENRLEIEWETSEE